MKKVLILTVTAGNGHNSAARAMVQRLEGEDCEVEVVDMLKSFAPRLTVWSVDTGYNIAVGSFRPIYNFIFRRCGKSTVENAPVCKAQTTVKGVSGGLLKLIYSFKPDVIYATSFYCAIAVTNLKRVYDIPARLVTVMLDYEISPYWEATAEGVDTMGLSHPQFEEGMKKRGFSDSQLTVTGIPVSGAFSSPCDKAEKRRALGLDENIFTVLIMFGGGNWRGGYSAFKALVKRFKEPLQIIIINGHDKRAKKKIDKKLLKYPRNITVYNTGFTDRVEELMTASDVIVGKGGGLSLTESINRALPVIATDKLPEQEIHNVKFLADRGAALTFKNGKELAERVKTFYDDPQLLKQAADKLSALKTDGVENLARVILDAPCADYSGVDTTVDFGRVNKIVTRARKRARRKMRGEAKAR